MRALDCNVIREQSWRASTSLRNEPEGARIHLLEPILVTNISVNNPPMNVSSQSQLTDRWVPWMDGLNLNVTRYIWAVIMDGNLESVLTIALMKMLQRGRKDDCTRLDSQLLQLAVPSHQNNDMKFRGRPISSQLRGVISSVASTTADWWLP